MSRTRFAAKRCIASVQSLPDFSAIMRGSVGVPTNRTDLARHAHADFDFRTDGYPVDEFAEKVSEKEIAFVSAVEAYLLSEQTGTDSYFRISI